MKQHHKTSVKSLAKMNNDPKHTKVWRSLNTTKPKVWSIFDKALISFPEKICRQGSNGLTYLDDPRFVCRNGIKFQQTIVKLLEE